MKNKKPTVTIALTALNEEKNIKTLLESILMQKENGFSIQKILVISDGSTDKTVEIVKSIKSKKIILKSHKDRQGKPSRLNHIYQTLSTDILVQTDADVVFANPYVVSRLVTPFIKNEKIGLVCGRSIPMEARSFTEKAVNCTYEVYDKLKNVNNALTVNGCSMAIKKELAKSIHLPENLIGEDVYAYFHCLMSGYKYKYAKNAEVYYRLPTSISDQIKQNTRFLATPNKMTSFFPEELVKKEDYIPPRAIFKNMAIEFIKHPILCTYISGVNLFCRLKAISSRKNLNSKWQIALSTKKTII